jgi:hypothetical protein
VAQPAGLLAQVRGMGRDFAVDELPPGFVWDMVDYIPNRRGAKLEGRGPWSYLTTGSPPVGWGTIWGGKHAAFTGGTKLILHAGDQFWDHPVAGGAVGWISGWGSTLGLQNGVMLRNRCYFADGNGLQVPRWLTWTGSAWTSGSVGATGPKAKIIDVFKDRLIGAGDPAQPQRVSFSPLETDGGPPGVWDALSYVDTSRSVSAIAPMAAQILCFHAKSIEKIRGSIPPGTNLDTDMFLDAFSDQMGCVDPASVVNWQENVIFANARGIHLTDGATIRSLTDQGSIGDFWRTLYSRKRANTRVSAGVYLDFLFVTVLTDYIPPGDTVQQAVTLVCNLNERTWFRFANLYSSCYVESESGGEQMWAGLDTDNRLTQVTPLFSWDVGLPDGGNPAPTVNAVDGNAKPVLPLVDLGWKRLGPEGVKRMRHAYVSYQTQTVDPVAYPEVLRVEYETDIRMERDNFVTAGTLPNALRYSRRRLNLGRPGYGIHFVIRQIAPTYLSRVYEVGVEQWPLDRGHL